MLAINLESEGYLPVQAATGSEALQNIRGHNISLVILDVMLPDMDGTRVCAEIKREYENIPVLMLSALGQSNDRIRGLKAGADDYLPKPFNLEELLLRIKILLNRGATFSPQEKEIRIGDRVFNAEKQIVSDGDKVYQLSTRESHLLKHLIRHQGEVLDREHLLRHVWGHDVVPNTRTVDNFIRALRTYIEPDPKSPRFLKTIRGRGYFLSLDV